MKVLYVGGKHLINRFSNLEAAVERAQNDDIIELCKDVFDVEIYINKNITIHGNGHIITPANGKAAFDCASFVTLKDIKFRTKPRTNAVILRSGGCLEYVTTQIIGPARALYPTIVQRSGDLKMNNCNIMFMETYKSHSGKETCTTLTKCVIEDYYDGNVYLNDNDYNMSKFRGIIVMYDCIITRTLFDGDCSLSDTHIKNFNKAVGLVKLHNCSLCAEKRDNIYYQGEPVDGPLKNAKFDIIPFSLHIAGGRVITENHSSETRNGAMGFYMTGGSLDIRSTVAHNDQARHLIKGGAIMFNNVTDNGFYDIRQATCGIVQSHVHTSIKTKSAMEQLDNMIGLESVKKQIHTMMNTIKINMAYPERNFGFSHHMIFAGDPGTGKTTAARLVAQALFEIGVIPENKCMEVPASQLIKGYVGQTGAHVESVLKQALGGVLFIDEAYELMIKDGQNTFNNDALAVLLRYMEDHRDDLVVIAAGYEKEMREFVASNAGLARRFQWITFENYTPEEMTEIFMSMAQKCQESFDTEQPYQKITKCLLTLSDFYLSHLDAKGHITNGGNGGLVRNLFQQIVFARNNRVAERLSSSTGLTVNHLSAYMGITNEDIQAGLSAELKKAMNLLYGTTFSQEKSLCSVNQ